jgi:hypothetical protein
MRASKSRPRVRFWVEAFCAAVGLVLAGLTLVMRDWFEQVTATDPDGGSGALEWVVVVALLALAVLNGTVAAAEWRRPRSASA